ncbi:putative trehalase [Smittium culicis]|uniref:Trehalase n=1 Tax=Smittium culicis TaxID=133412 RepID=A0A1R1X625_9FUNG|nr:putative trehalase [Smittium culicis]
MGDSSKTPDAYAPHDEYYRSDYRKHSIVGALSTVKPSLHDEPLFIKRKIRSNSLGGTSTPDNTILIDVESTEKELLRNEDMSGNFQITVHDIGPKLIRVPTLRSQGHRKIEIRGNYMLSNLLQEIGLAKTLGKKSIAIDLNRLNENPVTRLLRMIRTVFWSGLTRRMDESGIEKICNDPKNRNSNSTKKKILNIYVPYGDAPAFKYYNEISQRRPELNLNIIKLPKDITPEYVKSINTEFGILTLSARINENPCPQSPERLENEENSDNYRNTATKIAKAILDHQDSIDYMPKITNSEYDPIPFIVPGGRFNEMYGWDSYFIVLGILECGHIEMSKGMVEHFIYQINNYGKILNANRSYYLTRSQPPFLTDMTLRTFEHLDKTDENLQWLKRSFEAAIKEYNEVWTSFPRIDKETGLSCYHPTGIGMPPETEQSHYDHVIEPYSKKLGLSIEEYTEKYNSGEIHEPLLDTYFIHDRAVRESGHDTTYRLDKKCAHLATVDLNALLYKYEIDIAKVIDTYFSTQDSYIICKLTGKPEVSSVWYERAKNREIAISKYLYNKDKKLYFDYNVKTKKQENYESVTCFYTLWSGCATPQQAKEFIPVALKKFCHEGGLVCGTKESRGHISLDRPNRQWDYPFGWAPHQILAWKGLVDYGETEIATMLAYRWLYVILKSYTEFNGVVPEKFDVVNITHLFDVEYGNVGTDFKLVSTEGFGWMNSSIELGLNLLSEDLKRSLASLVHPDKIIIK